MTFWVLRKVEIDDNEYVFLDDIKDDIIGITEVLEYDLKNNNLNTNTRKYLMRCLKALDPEHYYFEYHLAEKSKIIKDLNKLNEELNSLKVRYDKLRKKMTHFEDLKSEIDKLDNQLGIIH